jgi:hypothetical protein
MSKLYAQETWIDRTRNCGLGESDVYETFSNEAGDLYRAFQREYGRCMSRVYVDTPDGAKAIGWVFIQRTKYSDSPKTFLRETWITLHTAPPEHSIKYHYVGYGDGQ